MVKKPDAKKVVPDEAKIAEEKAAVQERAAKAKPGEPVYDERGKLLRTDMPEPYETTVRSRNAPAVARHPAQGTVSLSDERAEGSGDKPEPGEAPVFSLPYGSEPQTATLSKAPDEVTKRQEENRKAQMKPPPKEKTAA